MSRLVVRNLPNIKEDKLKETFSSYGSVTDVKLMFKDTGAFRNMAQIGFKTKEEAALALEKLNTTYLKGRKIEIQFWQEEKVKSSKGTKLQSLTSGIEEKPIKEFDNLYTVKLKNLPLNCKKSQLKKFFKPCKLVSIRIPSKYKTFAFVKFQNNREFKLGLHKDKSILEGKQIRVLKFEEDDSKSTSSKKATSSAVDINRLSETGRLFIRNLSYALTEDEIRELFEKYGPIKEAQIPFDSKNNRGKGIAFITLEPEKALRAFADLDRTIFQGRILHLIPSNPKENSDETDKDMLSDKPTSNFKKTKIKELKENSDVPFNWNSLFFGNHALFKAIPEKFNIDKDKIINPDKDTNPSVLMALGEAQIVSEMKLFFAKNGINVDRPVNSDSQRSTTTIIIKNLPADTDPLELRARFDVHGVIKRFVHPPRHCVFAIMEYESPSKALKAFKKEAYSQFHTVPLFLEWAPEDIFSTPLIEPKACEDPDEPMDQMQAYPEEHEEVGSTLYVKNLNFNTVEMDLQNHFSKIGPISKTTISRQKDNNLSYCYGFVEYADKESAREAIKKLQHSILDGNTIDLQISHPQNKKILQSSTKTVNTIQKGSTLLVKNVAFQANKKEVSELFGRFGKLRSVRLPIKSTGSNHKGYAFVEYQDENDAKQAFNNLKDSTHLFGRRLVLEWANPGDN